MEVFYELFFEPETAESYAAFSIRHGYNWAGYILLISTLLIAGIYYLYFGNKHSKYATSKKWLVFAAINSGIVFLFTSLTVGLASFDSEGIGQIPAEVWFFGIVNLVYAFFFFFVLSMALKFLSAHAKYSPF